MSELLDKQVNAQKESLNKYFWGSSSSRQPMKKCVMKIKETNKKKSNARLKMLLICTLKNVIDGRRRFIGSIQKTGEDDLDKL